MSEGPDQPGSKTTNRILSALFWSLLVIYCGWILSFRVFPSQDGSIHLYYASILSHLGDNTAATYSKYFFVRRPIPPYALHYWLLLLLRHAGDFLLAEKLIVALIVVLFTTGCAYLTGSLSPRIHLCALLGVPLSLNWTVGMGFHNYALSMGFSFFAMACWFRRNRTSGIIYRGVLVAICILMLFTHPVPLLVTLAICGADLVRGWVVAQGLRGLVGPDVFTYLIACSSLGYVALFVSGEKSQANLHHPWIQAGMLRDALFAKPFMLVWHSPLMLLYAVLLFVFLGVCLWLGARQLRERWKTRSFEPADVFSASALALFVLYPFIPRNMNGSDFFADRLLIYLWLFAACGTIPRIAMSARTELRLGVAVAATAVLLLTACESDMRAASNTLAQMEDAKTPAPGLAGIFVDAPLAPVALRTTFDPFLWSAARYFRRTGTVMLNAPWLDLPILPIGARESMLAAQFPARTINYPDRLASLLIQSNAARAAVSPKLSFLLFVGKSDSGPIESDHLLQVAWPHAWRCRPENWYAVCAAQP